MKILQIEDETWDSGIAHYALTLSVELARRGHKVLFWGRKKGWPVERAKALGLKTLSYARPWLSLPSLRSHLKRAGVDLINAHTGSSHSLAAMLSAGSRIPVVRTRGDIRAPARHALARALAKRTRAFVAANSSLRDMLRDAYPGARVELIHQGIESSPPQPLPSKPIIGILGRLDPVKGHMDLITAARAIMEDWPDARFLAAGPETRPEWREALKRTAGRYGLDGAFEFLGRVEDAASFMARCRVGVVASTGSEAVSRAALEWMSMGRPLVATTVGCLPDLVEDGVTGRLIPPTDPRSLAGAIDAILADPLEAQRMGSQGRRRFERFFSLKRFVDATERLYQELTGASDRC